MKLLCRWFGHKWEPDAQRPKGDDRMHYFFYCLRCNAKTCENPQPCQKCAQL